MIEIPSVTRLEIIDSTPCTVCKGKSFVRVEGEEKPVECPNCQGGGCLGRVVIFHSPNKELQLSLQDDEQTLKIFINERIENENHNRVN